MRPSIRRRVVKLPCDEEEALSLLKGNEASRIAGLALISPVLLAIVALAVMSGLAWLMIVALLVVVAWLALTFQVLASITTSALLRSKIRRGDIRIEEICERELVI